MCQAGLDATQWNTSGPRGAAWDQRRTSSQACRTYASPLLGRGQPNCLVLNLVSGGPVSMVDMY